MENMDLLFAQVGDINTNQQKLSAQFSLSTQVMEQLLADQQLLAKQIDATGQAVARLTLNHENTSRARPPSPASSEEQADHRFQYRRRTTGDPSNQRTGFTSHKQQHVGFGSSQTAIPKLSCPRFEGSNPRIWRDKCSDYFHICNVPESMWPLVASLHMDGVASSWLQVYKAKDGLGTWEQFMYAVERKFGANDYRVALGELMELKQTSSVEDYIVSFEELQYQLTMHNMGLDEMFFCYSVH